MVVRYSDVQRQGRRSSCVYSFGWYDFLCSGTVNMSSSCDSPLVPVLCTVMVFFILRSQISFMERVYGDRTFLGTDASITE